MSEVVECTCGPTAPYDSHDWDCPQNPQNWEAQDLRAAAEWLVGVGYPFDFTFTPRAPEALWQQIVDVVHEDATGSLHGNELTREEVAGWLIDP